MRASPLFGRGSSQPIMTWTPTLIPSLVGWYDGSYEPNLVMSDGKVTNFRDRTNDSLATRVSEPSLDYLPFGTTGLMCPYWPDQINNMHFLSKSVTGRSFIILFQYRDGQSLGFSEYGHRPGPLSVGSSSSRKGTFSPVAGLLEGSSYNGWDQFPDYAKINDVFNTSQHGDDVLPLPPTMAYGSYTNSPGAGTYMLGMNRGFNNRCWSGPIAEVLIFNGALNSEEIPQVFGYLAWKWGFTSLLPANSQFVNTPPQAPA